MEAPAPRPAPGSGKIKKEQSKHDRKTDRPALLNHTQKQYFIVIVIISEVSPKSKGNCGDTQGENRTGAVYVTVEQPYTELRMPFVFLHINLWFYMQKSRGKAARRDLTFKRIGGSRPAPAPPKRVYSGRNVQVLATPIITMIRVLTMAPSQTLPVHLNR